MVAPWFCSLFDRWNHPFHDTSNTKEAGMSLFPDVLDWLVGYPFERLANQAKSRQVTRREVFCFD